MSIPTTVREYRLPKPEGWHNLVIKESPLAPPKAREVLVRIYAVSLQSRDLKVSKSSYSMGIRLKKNLVPCSDCAGQIVAIGEDVNEWRKGDRVCANFALDHIYGDVTPAIYATGLGAPIDGVLTEYRCFPARSLVRIPEHLTYEEASTLPCAALTAYSALMGSTPLKGGDTVLVQGTGGVSIFGLQLAVASGATVILTSSSDEKLMIGIDLGASYVINYNTTPNWDEEVLRITNGRGVDHVLEVGGPGTMPKSLKSVRHGGSIYIAGVLAQGVSDNSNIIFEAILRTVTLRGIQIGSVHQFVQMNRLITSTRLRPVIDKVFSFEKAPEAYEYLNSQKHVGKVVIKVSTD